MLSFDYYRKCARNGSFCLYHPGYNRLSSQIYKVPQSTKGIIAIMIGTNDFFFDSPLGSTEEALSTPITELNDEHTFANAFRYNLVELRKRAPEATIIVIQPLPSNDINNAYDHYDESNLFVIRDIEREICHSMNIPIVESQEVFGFDRDNGDWSFFFNDFCHPNNNGYMRIAECLYGVFLQYF